MARLRAATLRPTEPPKAWHVLDPDTLTVDTVTASDAPNAVAYYEDGGTSLGHDHDFGKLIERCLHGGERTDRDRWVGERLGELTGVLGGNGWGWAPWVVVVAEIVWQSLISNAPWEVCKAAVVRFLTKEKKAGRGPGWQDMGSERAMLRTVERIASQEGLEEFYVQMEFEYRQGPLARRVKKKIQAKGRRQRPQ